MNLNSQLILSLHVSLFSDLTFTMSCLLLSLYLSRSPFLAHSIFLLQILHNEDGKYTRNAYWKTFWVLYPFFILIMLKSFDWEVTITGHLTVEHFYCTHIIAVVIALFVLVLCQCCFFFSLLLQVAIRRTLDLMLIFVVCLLNENNDKSKVAVQVLSPKEMSFERSLSPSLI